jgi:hypothetical protein
MLLPLIARIQGAGRFGIDPYAAWSSAIAKLRADLEGDACIEPAELTAYLHAVPADQHLPTLQDLVTAHLQYIWKAGRGLLLEAYRYVLASVDTAHLPADLIEDEYLARHLPPHGDAPALSDYQRRFPQRADVARLLAARKLGDGRFIRLLKRGQGALGEVWEAYDRTRHELVAVKLPRSDSVNHCAAMECFEHEVRCTAGLQHPGTVHLEACRGEGGEKLYLMRLVNGRCLGDDIRTFHHPVDPRTPSDVRQSLQRMVTCLISACEAVDYAHYRGVVHRDLKPGNIIVEPDGRAAVLDWGLARASVKSVCDADARGFLASAQISGTPEYMAPEQLADNADERTDVFGLGATLYEILAGRPPYAWPGDLRPANWRDEVAAVRFAAPRRWNPSAPRALQRICTKALRREPDARFATVASLADALRTWCDAKETAPWHERLMRRLIPSSNATNSA